MLWRKKRTLFSHLSSCNGESQLIQLTLDCFSSCKYKLILFQKPVSNQETVNQSMIISTLQWCLLGYFVIWSAFVMDHMPPALIHFNERIISHGQGFISLCYPLCDLEEAFPPTSFRCTLLWHIESVHKHPHYSIWYWGLCETKNFIMSLRLDYFLYFCFFLSPTFSFRRSSRKEIHMWSIRHQDWNLTFLCLKRNALVKDIIKPRKRAHPGRLSANYIIVNVGPMLRLIKT